ncbi:MAG: hypothetical protein ACPGFA_01265 [Pikeienuella sp.]
MPNPRHKRPPKFDTLTSPEVRGDYNRVAYAMAPFNRVSHEMDQKWGIDRLPELVSPDLANRFGDSMTRLTDAIVAVDVDGVLSWSGDCIKGFAALDAEAERTGQPKADLAVWEIEIDGQRIGVMRDDRSWQSIQAARPDLKLITLREAAIAVLAYDLTGEVVTATKTAFPDAKVTAITERPPVDYTNGGDPIEF